jgi:pimeloyl-ACP methyl ester carboxylesterase
MARRMADDTPARTIYAQMGAIAAHNTRERLGELKGLPTLVVHGLEDGLVPADRGRELAALIPGAHLELVPSCSHLLTTDAEDEVAGAIVAHLEDSASVGFEEPGYAA